MVDTSIKAKTIVILLVIWVSISSASILVRLSGAVAEACAFWRLVFTLPILYVLGRINGLSSGYFDFSIYHFISGFALAMHFVLWMNSLFLIPVYTSTLLVTLYPLFSLPIEVLLFSMKPRGIQVAGLTLCILLLTLYLGIEGLSLNLGVLEALLGGLFASLYFTTGYYARTCMREPTTTYAFKSYLLAAVSTGVAGFLRGSNLLHYSLLTYVFFILLAVVPMMLGHTLMNYLLRIYTASLVTAISFGEPYGAGLLAYILLSEPLRIRQLILGTIIVITVFTTIIKTKEPRYPGDVETPCKRIRGY